MTKYAIGKNRVYIDESGEAYKNGAEVENTCPCDAEYEFTMFEKLEEAVAEFDDNFSYSEAQTQIKGRYSRIYEYDALYECECDDEDGELYEQEAIAFSGDGRIEALL